MCGQIATIHTLIVDCCCLWPITYCTLFTFRFSTDETKWKKVDPCKNIDTVAPFKWLSQQIKWWERSKCINLLKWLSSILVASAVSALRYVDNGILTFELDKLYVYFLLISGINRTARRRAVRLPWGSRRDIVSCYGSWIMLLSGYMGRWLALLLSDIDSWVLTSKNRILQGEGNSICRKIGRGVNGCRF